MRSRWRLQDLQAVGPADLPRSLPGLSRALRRLRVRRQRGRLRVHSPDLAYHPKLALIARAVALAHARPAQVRVVYADECRLYRQPTLAATWSPQGVEPTTELAHGSDQFPHRYSGALDVVSGQVIWTAGPCMGVDGLCAFLSHVRTTVDAAAPPEAQAAGGVRLLLIWDNWPIHQHPTVLAHAAPLGIEVLWLPTYAPWTPPGPPRSSSSGAGCARRWCITTATPSSRLPCAPSWPPFSTSSPPPPLRSCATWVSYRTKFATLISPREGHAPIASAQPPRDSPPG